MTAAHSAEPVFDAVVAKSPDQQEVPVFAHIGDAIAAASEDGRKPFRICLGEGNWRERVVIDRPNVHLIGAGADKSILVFDRHAGIAGRDGKPIGTFETATLKVLAPGFRAENLTIVNDYDYVGNRELAAGDGTIGHHHSQAVALAIEGRADRTLLRGVYLIGHQDTLYVQAGRCLFDNCRIEGSVDFIFGGGRAFFRACTIVSRLRPGQEVNGFIAAPNTDIRQPVGLVFHRCRLEKEHGVAARSVALGRPWRQTTPFPDGFYGNPDHVGASTYLECWMDDHIVPEGWHPMAYNARGGGRAELRPEEARLFEYASTGPGAGQPSPQRRMLTVEQARDFGIDEVLEGWVGQ